ncbi:MAG: ferritin [Desulfuromonadales bacterium GWD2_61_12]|nr:MAG: ferritin [Desulfuromonadales bacterium GWC2_61_20]OGR33445.1 MAG: ferritin [Desulfuromonadales bacterium GWD2_61_12]HAD03752.1 ferritin [Desulfuromonas sp.]HBT84162.1 ferritin [Desulfuromonas sp.]
MTTQRDVCFTIEAALEMAVQMEHEGFRHYLLALRVVKNKAAQEILRDAALDELQHKLQLERALVLGRIDGEGLDKPVPTMNLDYVLQKKELRPDSDNREALAYAIHLEKGALDFYRRMAAGCAGAPMATLFEQIANDETRHLQQLEDLYEEHFLTEN